MYHDLTILMCRALYAIKSPILGLSATSMPVEERDKLAIQIYQNDPYFYAVVCRTVDGIVDIMRSVRGTMDAD
jgi:hypothetical protein